MRLPLASTLGLILCAAAAPAMAEAPAESWQPPVLTTERYNEDWSTLADPARRSGHWSEGFKYIPLDDAGSAYLTTGIEIRLRNENYQGNALGNAQAPDNGYLWMRALPYADLHVGHIRAFVQPVVAYAAGVAPAPSAVDQTRLDLLQGFADADIDLDAQTSLRLRAGREMVGLGTERLVGTRYGPNVPLAFDGLRAILHRDALTVNAFYLLPVEARGGTFDDRSSPTRRLWGIYATQMLGPLGVDAYYLGYRNASASFGDGTGRELRHTFGARLFGKVDGWHWNMEAMLQSGRFAQGSIAAWSIATEAGRSFPAAPLHPDLTLRFNIASGDKTPGDHRLGTFNALFPKGKYFGELSPVGPYNLVNLQPVLALDLGHGVGLSLAGGAYWRQSTGDGVYDIPGHLLRAANGSAARFVGTQAETAVQWRATQELTLSASLSFFRAGQFLRDNGIGTISMAGFEANFRL